MEQGPPRTPARFNGRITSDDGLSSRVRSAGDIDVVAMGSSRRPYWALEGRPRIVPASALVPTRSSVLASQFGLASLISLLAFVPSVLTSCESTPGGPAPSDAALELHRVGLASLPTEQPSSNAAPNGAAMAPDDFHRRIRSLLAAEGVSRVRDLSPQGKVAVMNEIAKTPAKQSVGAPQELKSAYAKYLQHLGTPGATTEDLAVTKAKLMGGAP